MGISSRVGRNEREGGGDSQRRLSGLLVARMQPGWKMGQRKNCAARPGNPLNAENAERGGGGFSDSAVVE